MDSPYACVRQQLCRQPRTWLVTGCAGFIGSNLLETLLRLDQRVVGLDNLSTGYRHNLIDVQQQLPSAQWQRFHFIEGDVCDLSTCRQACAGVDVVLHQAALGSVPRSLLDPLATHHNNVTGLVTLLQAAREAGLQRLVYASSSAVYGDHPALPKQEGQIGNALSPYALSKRVDELYAEVFARCYGVATIGLRYFNVFGKRQDPAGAYAAVIPRWLAAMLADEVVDINGDGETSRDFCYIDNAVQANLLAALAPDAAWNQVYNVAVGGRTSLNDLFACLKMALAARGRAYVREPLYRPFRAGDVRHSQADTAKARQLLGYAPEYPLADGITALVNWWLALGSR